MQTGIDCLGVTCDHGVVVSTKDDLANVRCPGWIAS